MGYKGGVAAARPFTVGYDGRFSSSKDLRTIVKWKYNYGKQLCGGKNSCTTTTFAISTHGAIGYKHV